MTKPSPDASPIKRVNVNTPPEEAIQLLKQDGVLVLQGFLSQDIIKNLRAEIKPAIEDSEKNPKEGTKHVANLTAFSKTYRHDILNTQWMHSLLEPLFRGEFGDYWMNLGAIQHIEPGQPAQRLHRNDMLYRVTKLRRRGDPDFMVNILVAVTEIDEDNGATRFVPGSHQWDNDTHPIPSPEQAISVSLQPGDAVLFVGSLWHGAGPNKSEAPRQELVLNIHPCHFTPLESHLHLPRALVESMTSQAQRMIGWRSLHTQTHIPIWMAGDDKMEERIGLRSQEVQ